MSVPFPSLFLHFRFRKLFKKKLFHGEWMEKIKAHWTRDHVGWNEKIKGKLNREGKEYGWVFEWVCVCMCDSGCAHICACSQIGLLECVHTPICALMYVRVCYNVCVCVWEREWERERERESDEHVFANDMSVECNFMMIVSFNVNFLLFKKEIKCSKQAIYFEWVEMV